MVEKKIRPYQEEALHALGDAWRGGAQSALVVMPTGTGKTIFFSEVAKRVSRGVLVLTHRKDLVHQTAEKMRWWCEEPVAIEMAEYKEISQPDGHFTGDPIPRIGVASIQTMASEKRLAAIDPSRFPYIIMDEAHHATASTWRQVVEHFPEAWVLGVTATPDRADEEALGQIFQTVAYEYCMKDAIYRDKYLVPIKVFAVNTRIELDGITVRLGDFAKGELQTAMLDPQAIQQICDPLMRERDREDRPAVLFCVGVKHAELCAAYMNAVAGTDYARALSAKHKRDEREKAQSDLECGKLKVLTNVGLFTEGWDCPPVSLVAMGRPTKSRALYAQMLGRGTRLSPETNKTNCICLDYMHNSNRHKLVTAVNIFQGEYSDDVAKMAEEIATVDDAGLVDGGEDIVALDVGELLDRCFAEFTENRREVLYELSVRDPFAAVGIDLEAYQEDGPLQPKITEKQASFLIGKGVKSEDVTGLSKRMASKIIDKLMNRSDKGLCTPKQAKILAKYGCPPQSVTFAEATDLIDFIAAGDWRDLPASFELESWRTDRKEASRR